MTENTYYEILEIAETATDGEIGNAYRRLSHEYHPDKVPSHLSKLKQIAVEKFKQINEAYEVLRNPDKRRQYDNRLQVKRTGTQYNNRQTEQQKESRKSASDDQKPKLKVSRKKFEFKNSSLSNSNFTITNEGSFTIINEGGGILNGIIKTNKNWLTVSQSNFNIRDKQNIEFCVNTSFLALKCKTYGIIEIQSNGGVEKIYVTVSVGYTAEGRDTFASRKKRNKFTVVQYAVIILIAAPVILAIVAVIQDESKDGKVDQAVNTTKSPDAKAVAIPTDIKSKEIYQLRSTAEKGDAVEQYDLGMSYYSGFGSVRDYKKAMKWFKLAAEQGSADAMYTLGVMYDRGEGVAQNEKEAAKWYKLAAERGKVDAQYRVGYNYYYGFGTVQDYKEAMKWYELAAEQGSADAMYTLGVMYDRGEGVAQNGKEAAKWYELAAEQGDAYAPYQLGEMYFYGNGVAQDYIAAHMWFNICSANGEEDGASRRKLVEEKMTPSQIAEAQRLAKEWMEKHQK